MARPSSRDSQARGANVQNTAPRAELTERELDVARLVAAGLRNREIAAQLAVSVRTAESHVDRIRLKLGFRSRTEIARWIAQRDVLEALGRTWPLG
jgi:DNA-binding NarL/FixJ family response regulator